MRYRSLQDSDGASIFEKGTEVLSAKTADLLSELAELVDDDSAALSIKRAEALAGRSNAGAIIRQIAEEGSAPPLEGRLRPALHLAGKDPQPSALVYRSKPQRAGAGPARRL